MPINVSYTTTRSPFTLPPPDGRTFATTYAVSIAMPVWEGAHRTTPISHWAAMQLDGRSSETQKPQRNHPQAATQLDGVQLLEERMEGRGGEGRGGGVERGGTFVCDPLMGHFATRSQGTPVYKVTCIYGLRRTIHTLWEGGARGREEGIEQPLTAETSRFQFQN